MFAKVRFGAFAGVLFIMGIWELISPRRKLTQRKPLRWFINLALTGVDFLLVHFLMGAIAVTAAYFAQQQQWGVLHMVSWPPYVKMIAALLFLDFAIYVQHLLMHAMPLLWRLHMVHHTDLDFDVTTGLRFHPLEIILSLAYKVCIILLLGADPITVVIFEIILNSASEFNHGNVKIPLSLDRWLRWIIVTPDVHRIHHSTAMRETNSNFGFSVTWWDRLFGTFRNQPKIPHTEMEIGLKPYREQKELGLWGLLMLPFSREKQQRVESYSFKSPEISSD